ncbi:trypsin-like peptidase domain-containing protein [Sporosarcina jeotgali]|uniref:Trypsin-like peptidase domain-containing protein n=1 Tax=Sporosarcina jeotgali TaxID=3020056 RepID=A0ABZ0KW88_9BACL|nr:trypsin-like peptidase domain-containing protein [Sporosarcina sp. B2O-1]WOV84153.1 trypsin-like peptidase domain-containing protein [Sporosarcina sp. B2O-1]
MNTSKSKWLLSTVGAGVLGSALTLGAVTNTDILKQDSGTRAAVQSDNTAPYNVQTTGSTSQSTLSDMVADASKAIVGVDNYQSAGNRFAGSSESQKVGTGSGVVFKTEGSDAYIITNNHVIEDASKIGITTASGKETEAVLVGTDPLTDLAVLKMDKKYAEGTLAYGDSEQLRAGDAVVAIGNPLGLDFSGTVTQGIVSAPTRSIDVDTSAGKWEMDVIQTDAAINPGNSGGALLNASGELIGINSLKIAQNGVEGLGFAIPSNDVKPLVEKLMKDGKITRPYIGVGLVDLADVPEMYVRDIPDSVKGGVMVGNVDPDSPAGKAGFREEDVITEVNGKAIDSSTALRKILYTDLKVGDQAKFTIYREGKQQVVNITLTSNADVKK